MTPEQHFETIEQTPCFVPHKPALCTQSVVHWHRHVSLCRAAKHMQHEEPSNTSCN